MPDYHVKLVSARDLTSLIRRWQSSLFLKVNKCQVDMETLRRDCKHEFDSEFGAFYDHSSCWFISGRVGTGRELVVAGLGAV